MPTPRPTPTPADDALLLQHGLDLSGVTWGYQALFREILTELLRCGLAGERHAEVTRVLADALRHADRAAFDSVLRSYLEALRGRQRWILRLPRLFERWTVTGLDLTRLRHFLGLRFFELTRAGRLGQTPADLEFLLDLVAHVRTRDPELLGALLQGFDLLLRNLEPDQVREYVNDACLLAYRNPEAARGFLSGELRTARQHLDELARRARRDDLREGLERLLRGMTGRAVAVRGLEDLDPDAVQDRACRLAAGADAVYLAAGVAEFATREENRACLKALTTVAAACHLADGFACVHGTAGYAHGLDLFRRAGADAVPLAACFAWAEEARVLGVCRRRWPGLTPWLERLARLEYGAAPAVGADPDAGGGASERVSRRLTLGGAAGTNAEADLAAALEQVAADSAGWRGTLDRLSAEQARLVALYRAAGCTGVPRAVCFFPDPFLPLLVSPPPGARAVDLRRSQGPRLGQAGPEPPQVVQEILNVPDRAGAGLERLNPEPPRADDEGTVLAGYFYDEWNALCGDYQRQWCCVRERRPAERTGTVPQSPALLGYADQVRAVFERLRPQETRRETRLREGDEIHLDHFVEYVSQREIKRDTEMRFYNKPLTRRRDVAVGILLDLSGSTADLCRERAAPAARHAPEHRRGGGLGVPEFTDPDAAKTVLEVEKEAAFVLGTGLAALGDCFGVFGFTGTGRGNCQFHLFKEFEDGWDTARVQALLGAVPGSSTRIGPALRHAGWKLARRGAHTKLLLLITDGKPCDQGYETENRYAHHDVRKACQENARQQIHTFCVSTRENTPADMELMFPAGRYLILGDVAALPAALSRLYLRLTR